MDGICRDGSAYLIEEIRELDAYAAKLGGAYVSFVFWLLSHTQGKAGETSESAFLGIKGRISAMIIGISTPFPTTKETKA